MTNDVLAMIAVPLLLAGAVLLFARPVVGLFLVAGTIPLEAALMLGGASAARLIGMAVFGTWIAQKVLRREPLGPLVSPGLVQVAILLLALASLSVFWAEYPEVLQRRLFLLFQLILLCVLVFDLARSWERLAWVAKFLVLGATVAALLTLEQYFVGGVRRAGGGVVGGLNRTAATLVTVVPFAFYLVRSREPVFWRLLGLSYIGLAGVAVAATLSRMSYLVFPLVVVLHLALIARTRRGRWRTLLVGAIAVVAFSLLPMDAVRQRAESIVPYLSMTVGSEDPYQSYSARGFHMRAALAMFMDYPILGVGYHNYNPHFMGYQLQVPGAWRIYEDPQSPHSSHFGFLANLGIVGFLLWLTLFAVAFQYLSAAWRTARDPTSPQALLVHAVTFALAVSFMYGFYAEVHQDKVFWMTLGLAVAVRLPKPGRSGHSPTPWAGATH